MVEFFETNSEKKLRKRQIENDKQRLKNSEFLNNLKEEISDKPKLIESYENNYDKYMKDIENFENEHFTNIKVPKKIQKILKKKDRKNDDLNYFDKEIKQMSNVLFNDNLEEEKIKENNNKYLLKKRFIENEIKENNKNKKAFKNKKKKH